MAYPYPMQPQQGFNPGFPMPMMGGPVPMYGGSPIRYSGYNNDDAGDSYEAPRSANRASSGNSISLLTILGVGAAAIAGTILLKRFMTPSVLKNLTSVTLEAAGEGGNVARNVYGFTSKAAAEGSKVATGTMELAANEGNWFTRNIINRIFGKPVTLKYAEEGGEAIERTVRTWRVPGEVRGLLKNGPDVYGSPMFWNKVATETEIALASGTTKVPAGAVQAPNVFGQTVYAQKIGPDQVKIFKPIADGKFEEVMMAWHDTPDALRSFFIANG